jgi:cytochrome P450
VSFAKPEAYNDILLVRQDQEQFLKSPVWWGKQPGQDVSIVNAINPEMHAQIRRTIMGGFTTRALKAQEPIVQRYVNLLVDRLKENMSKEVHGKEAVVDIAPWFQFVTFDIFGDLGFGESFNCLEQAKYHAWIELLFNSIKASVFVASARYYPLIDSLLMKLIPPSLKKMQNDHYQHIVDKVQRRLNWELERPDLMSHVINQGDGKKRLPLGMISSTFSLMAIAGSETTATLLTGTMNLLLAQPTRLAILVEELRASFSSTEEMTLDALKSLPYLNAVLKEGLRLCPPVPWVLPRKVPVGGGTVCGVGLPEGVSNSLCTMPVFHTMLTPHRHQSQFKRGPSIAIRPTSTQRNPSFPSAGSLRHLLIPNPRTSTTSVRHYSPLVSVPETASVSSWHGRKCDSYYQSCSGTLNSKLSRVRR